MKQDERFWENIISGDETWYFAYDPATKRQSAEWAGQNSPKPKKLRFQKSRVKTMLIVFFRRRRCNSSRVCPWRAKSKCRIPRGCFGSAT